MAELPEGCVETGRLTIIRYFDPDAESGQAVMVDPSYRLGVMDAFGMIEVAKLIIARDADEDD